MKNLKDQLAGIAALVAAIVAIGGGFVKYGEITTKLADEIDGSTNHSHTKPLVNSKEIELLKVQIEEIKVSTSNPLSQ